MLPAPHLAKNHRVRRLPAISHKRRITYIIGIDSSYRCPDAIRSVTSSLTRQLESTSSTTSSLLPLGTSVNPASHGPENNMLSRSHKTSHIGYCYLAFSGPSDIGLQVPNLSIALKHAILSTWASRPRTATVSLGGRSTRA